MAKPYKMKGSPMQKNFGISPAKGNGEVVSKTSPGSGWTKTKGTNIWAPPVGGKGTGLGLGKMKTTNIGDSATGTKKKGTTKTKKDNLIQKLKKRQAKNIEPFQKKYQADYYHYGA